MNFPSNHTILIAGAACVTIILLCIFIRWMSSSFGPLSPLRKVCRHPILGSGGEIVIVSFKQSSSPRERTLRSWMRRSGFEFARKSDMTLLCHSDGLPVRAETVSVTENGRVTAINTDYKGRGMISEKPALIMSAPGNQCFAVIHKSVIHRMMKYR